jgi:hypothetical protein
MVETIAILLAVWWFAIPSLVIGIGLRRARVAEGVSPTPRVARWTRACERRTRAPRTPGARTRPTQLS